MTETIKAEIRNEFGKGASRRLRREDKLPAVIYGHGEDPVHVALDYHTAFLAIRGNANALLTIDVEGDEQLALVKDVQRNPLLRVIEHVDLLRVKKGEKVQVDVPVVVEGEPKGDAIATVELQTISVLAPATAIPESFIVNVEGREEGENTTVADLDVPADVEIEIDGEELVVVVAVPVMDLESSAETEEAEGEVDSTESAEAKEGGDSEAEGEESAE